MLINTGGRTDIVHFYTPWLLDRFKKGYVYVRNPLYPENVTRFELNPSVVDCVLFCSKNYAPILPRLTEITDKFASYFFYTITAYGRDVEPFVPDIDTSIDTLIKLEKIVGKERIAWRYDPVLLKKHYTIQQHLITFEHMAARLSGHVSKCIFSFVELYKKTRINFPELEEMTEEQKLELARGLGNIAAKYRIPIQSCASKEDWSIFGIQKQGCITLSTLSHANSLSFRDLKHTGMRKNCLCMKSSDIGFYDSCPAGCRYCYANENFEQAKKNYSSHNPSSPVLLGTIGVNDKISYPRQKSFLEEKELQMDLF